MKATKGLGLISIAIGALIGAGALAQPASATGLGGVSMQRACDNQYPGQGRVAKVLAPYNAFSWRCVTGVVPVAPGEISVEAECHVEYGIRTHAAYTNASSPYSWYCYAY